VVTNAVYIMILNNAIMVGLVVAGKRLVVGLLLSRQTFRKFFCRQRGCFLVLGYVASLGNGSCSQKQIWQFTIVNSLQP
jgi:hypothetical protein